MDKMCSAHGEMKKHKKIGLETGKEYTTRILLGYWQDTARIMVGYY
jgi:hypothetical protein